MSEGTTDCTITRIPLTNKRFCTPVPAFPLDRQ